MDWGKEVRGRSLTSKDGESEDGKKRNLLSDISAEAYHLDRRRGRAEEVILSRKYAYRKGSLASALSRQTHCWAELFDSKLRHPPVLPSFTLIARTPQ